MKSVISFYLALFCFQLHAQIPQPEFNLDLESHEKNAQLADDWFTWGTYTVKSDTVIRYSGMYSGTVLSDETGSSFGCIAYRIPATFQGDSITLEGAMRTENVENGFAGLLLRIDGGGSTLAFDNMQDRSIQGTRDWQRYRITLPYAEDAEIIFVAGILVGKGKAWFDDFQVSIDGKRLEQLEGNKPVPPARLDTEFDHDSRFRLASVTPQEVERLFFLCKVWGFLKYHHPEIAKGNINWDYALFRILPAIQTDTFQLALYKWVNDTGPILDSRDTEAISQDEIMLDPSTAWISDTSFLSHALTNKLSEIEIAPGSDKHYYIGLAAFVGNPVFRNENPYTAMQWNDTGFRLLALFRYWNMIEYFFPYKHLIGKDWNAILKEYIPKMVTCNTELAYKLTLLRLIGEVHDTHANIWQRDSVLTHAFGEKIAPVEVQILDDTVVVVRILDILESDEKIRVGDIIAAVDGVDVKSMIEQGIKFSPASNNPTKLRDVARKLLRTNSDVLHLTIERDSERPVIQVKAVDINDVDFWTQEITSHRDIADDIGYIYPGTLKRGEIDTIMGKFMSKKGLIVDLRCYPSDFIVFSLGKYLLPRPTDFVKFTTGSIHRPGQFTFTAPLQVGEERADYFKGKVVILINEKTQSQAEYTTMALRVAPNATVIGSTTAGADGNVSEIFLPGNVRTMISGIGVYYPDGRETQRIGIVPDIEVRPTLRGIREGRDELLEKAIAVIRE